MKYYLIAGEQSGDLHGSGVMNELKKIDGDAQFRFWGGDMMMAQGGTLVRHIRESSVMGFVEVVLGLKKILSALNYCKKDIHNYKPDALILIDYPGFNLRIAKFAKKQGIKVFYYISPKVWAWNESRVKVIRRYVDHMLTILPFETNFYYKHGIFVDYVGNPVVDAIENHKSTSFNRDKFLVDSCLEDKPIIALLPGSRKMEIEKSLSVMLSVTAEFPNYQFVVAGTRAVPDELYSGLSHGAVKVLFDQTYPLLQSCDAAVVVSGTATLETALLKTPMVVCYKGGWLSYKIAKKFIKVKFVSLVNLILGKEVVTELIQNDFSGVRLVNEIKMILPGAERREEMLRSFDELIGKIGEKGASVRAADKIYNYLKESV